MLPQERLALTAAWEQIRSAVLDAAPTLADKLVRLSAGNWREVPPRERQVILLAAHKNIDIDGPNERRELRARVQRLLEEPGDVAASSLLAVAAPEFVPQLDKLASATAAVREVRRMVPELSAATAARFLSILGYPIIATDAPRLRWLRRYGLLQGRMKPAAEKVESRRVLHNIAEAANVPLQELDAVLDAFTSGAGVAWCGAKPRCRTCPLRESCPTPESLRLAGVSESVPASLSLSASVQPEDRPREKLELRGAGALTDAELLAILLRSGTREENAVVLAGRLLREVGSIDRIERASTAQLAKIRGIGEVKAITIKAALELARRLRAIDPIKGDRISSAKDVFEILRNRFIGMKKEEFVLLTLSTKNVVMRIVTVSSGTLNQSLVHPREAFIEAVRDSAAAVVFAHNHPSGDPAPSRDDQVITDRLVKAGEIMGVRVLDHVIIGSEEYFSFADSGRLKGA